MATTAKASDRTVADLLADLGDIDPGRVRLHPTPGTATEDDLVRLNDRKLGLYELIDGVLVTKVGGLWESVLTVALASILLDFVRTRNLGMITGPDGCFVLSPGTVRAPSVAFLSWKRIRAAGGLTHQAWQALIPDFTVEVLRPGNQPAEMSRKRREFFAAGVRLVWEVEPRSRTVTVFRPDGSDTIGSGETLDGGGVLPGLVLPVARIFEDLDRRPAGFDLG